MLGHQIELTRQQSDPVVPMIAFVAEYADGDITIDGSEIIDAAWFSKDNLPQIPPTISIARRLIDWFSFVRQQL